MIYAVEMKNITKQFPGVLANDNITLNIKKQEVHSILGENGCGKSTLMNVLFGLHQADAGEIYINGEKVSISNPKDAHSLGIGMVHQHFMLVEQMSALENIIMGKELGRFFLDREQSYKVVEELVQLYGFKLDLNEKVANLSIGMKQRVEILKILYRGADIIILDEPTAVLTPQEVEELFNIIEALKESGKTIIFITHKLNEIMHIADTISVLRKGQKVATVEKSDTNPRNLARQMVGRDVETIVAEKKDAGDHIVLELKDVQLMENSKEKVSLQVREGEILGIAGVEGNGQLELEELIIGLLKSNEGEIFFNGIDVGNLNPNRRKSLGIGYIPSDRHRRAILPSSSVKENFLLGFHEGQPFVKNGFIQDKELKDHSDKMIKEFEIKVPNSIYPINNLSGGNQQKVVLAREISQDPKLIIAAQPIRGLDIGAIEYVHRTLLRLRDEGKAILLISAELTEVMNLSDRIAVLYEGEIRATLSRNEFDIEKIGLLMAGDKGGMN